MSTRSPRHLRSSPLARTSPKALLPTLACAVVFASPPCPARAPLSIRRKFCTAALVAPIVRNGLNCCFGIVCRVCRTCARPSIFAVASWRLCIVVRDRRLNDLDHADVLAPWTGDLLPAVRLQSAGCVSDLSSPSCGAENGIGPGWPLVLCLQQID